MINDAGAAQDVLRETLVRAAESSDFPGDPGSLRERLFSLTREQCLARPESGLPGAASSDTGVPPWQVAPPLMAWRAVMSLARPEREVLGFAAWQNLTPAQAATITGLSVPHLRELLSRAEEQLRRAVAAEVMAGPEAGECAQRTAILASGQGPTAAALRDQLLGHADSCQACGGRLPQRVSAAKIYRLLPFPVLTPQLTSELLAAVTAARDSRLAGRAGLSPEPATGRAGKGGSGGAGRAGSGAPLDWTVPTHRVTRWPGGPSSATPQQAAATGAEAGPAHTPASGAAATAATAPAPTPAKAGPAPVSAGSARMPTPAAGPAPVSAGSARVPAPAAGPSPVSAAAGAPATGIRAEPPLTPRSGPVRPPQPVPAAAGPARRPGGGTGGAEPAPLTPRLAAAPPVAGPAAGPAGSPAVPVPPAPAGQAGKSGPAAQTVKPEPAMRPGPAAQPGQSGPAGQTAKDVPLTRTGQPQAGQSGPAAQTAKDMPLTRTGQPGPASPAAKGEPAAKTSQATPPARPETGPASPPPAAAPAPAGVTPADRKPGSGGLAGLDLKAGAAEPGTGRPGGRASDRAGSGPGRGGRPARRRHSGRWLIGVALMVTVLMVVFGWLVPSWYVSGGGLRTILGEGRAPGWLSDRPGLRDRAPGQPGGGPAFGGRRGAGQGPGGSGPSMTGPGTKPVVGAQLMAYPGALDLGYRSAGTIIIAAPHGPVTWSARSSSVQVRLSRRTGTLGKGQRAGVAVAVQSASGGSAVIQIFPGALTIPVTWNAAPVPTPGCTPTPSPSPSPPSPSPAPSPSPPGSPSPTPDPPASSPGSPTTSGPDSGSPTASGSASPAGSGSPTAAAAAMNGPRAGYRVQRGAAHCSGARVAGPGGTARSGPVAGRPGA